MQNAIIFLKISIDLNCFVYGMVAKLVLKDYIFKTFFYFLFWVHKKVTLFPEISKK